MRGLHPLVEARIRQTGRAWKWRRFFAHAGWLGGGLSLAVLLLGLTIWRGWLRHPVAAGVSFAAVALAAGLAFLVIAVLAVAQGQPRSVLAGLIERTRPGLLDRLNTLVSLEGARQEPAIEPYFRRIEGQARESLQWNDGPSPFGRRPILQAWAACLLLAAATAWFYARFDPWGRLAFDDSPAEVIEKGSEALPEMSPPTDAAEIKTAWGEVRITEPGGDLKVTKVDVVPLQIEAASSDDLARARWHTAVGGGAPKEHSLPSPAEPHYAVYKPLLYVDEHRLSDWDVLSYHASVSSREGALYASEIYFLEVRPFREDILKMPGGEGGKAYRLLSELTGLIDRQKHVLRETHGHVSRRYETDALRRQDRRKLSDAEADLAEAARHLYARIAALENQDVAVVLDELAQAETSLARAEEALRGEAAPVPPEQDALQHLVATRKRLQKAITDNPRAFGENGPPGDEERSPVADPPDKLKQIAEFRNEEKAAKDLLDKAVDEQRRLGDRARSAEPSAAPELAREQERIRRSVAELASGHPRVFKGSEKEAAEADGAMKASARALDQADPGAAAAAAAGLEKLQALQRATVERAGGRQLAQAYRLRDMLEARARDIERVEEKPEALSDEEVDKRASEARQTTRELKKLVEETPAGEAFGAPLREAVGEGAQGERERHLDDLAQSVREERKRAASRVKDDLGALGEAFDRSAPKVVRELRRSDPLQMSGEEALSRALRQLESMAGSSGGPAIAPEDDAKQRREALSNLRRGADALYGKDKRMAGLVLRVEEALAKADKVDGARLKKLMDEIERFRVETNEARTAKLDDPRVRHLDPSRLPPAYRDRIQRYFEKLSEQ